MHQKAEFGKVKALYFQREKVKNNHLKFWDIKVFLIKSDITFHEFTKIVIISFKTVFFYLT